MKPVTVVTAYFDIGRSQFKTRPRDRQTYYDQFEFWARMQNPLVVYTRESDRADVLGVRAKFGLEALTTVIVIDNIFSIEPAIHDNMRAISQDAMFRAFRIMPNAPSGMADYSYLMLLKTWFLADAVRRGLTNETVAWLDFGFNHGGAVYLRPEEFCFTWESDPLERVVLFTMDEYDDRPIFEIVRRLSDCIMGAPILLPASRASDLWEVNREAMVTLIRVGLIDDDQLIQLLSFRMVPDLFELRRSDWFQPLKDLTGREFSMRAKSARSLPLRLARRALHRWRRHRLALANAVCLYQGLMRGRP